MKGFIFVFLLSLPVLGQSSLDCDKNIVVVINKIFNKSKKSIIHRCLHIQSMEKIITIVERAKDLGALSLFVFAEENLSISSTPISSIDSFAIYGLQEIASRGGGFLVTDGIGFFLREELSEGVIVLHFKNENNLLDMSLVRMTLSGELKNFNLSKVESEHLAMAQTNNMDLFVFKIAPGYTVDILPEENKLIIENRRGFGEREEIDLDRGRMPADL